MSKEPCAKCGKDTEGTLTPGHIRVFVCPECAGGPIFRMHGEDKPAVSKVCEDCHGEGTKVCPHCEGEGTVPCEECEGSGLED